MRVLCQFGSQDMEEGLALRLDGFREGVGDYLGQFDGLVSRFAGRLSPLMLLAAPQGNDRNYQFALDTAEPLIAALIAGLPTAELALFLGLRFSTSRRVEMA